jgi:glycosyltransferase involved in cell wall biosynthesis
VRRDCEDRSLRAQRWVVVHAGARDRYQIPWAFHEQSALAAFVTDWYSRLDKPPLKSLAQLLPAKQQEQLCRRYTPVLGSETVFDCKFIWARYALGRRLRCSWAHWRNSNRLLGEQAADAAARLGANILSTSYYAADAFRHYQYPGRRVLFQVHPSPLFLHDLYQRFLRHGGLFEGLTAESEMNATGEELELWQDEARMADTVTVASAFTAKSVQGVKRSGVATFVIPYGIECQAYRPRTPAKARTALTVLFVGSKVARKGLHLLLKAWRELAPRSSTLRIAGCGDTDRRILDEFKGTAEILCRLTSAELAREYRDADLFVLPSLAEGFGHVYLEALASGTPIVGTENTAVPDLLQEGDCGYMVKAGDVDSLANCLEHALSHPRSLQDMRAEARRVAEAHTWQRFRQELYAAAGDQQC